MEAPCATPVVVQSVTHQRLLLVIISVAAFMGALDTTIVNISLPTIADYFQTSVSVVSWVSMAYLLTLSSLLIAFGRLADLRGYRKVYLAGFAIFTAGSLLCGLSVSIGELIGFRIFQAIGAAMLQAIGGAMITMYLPGEVRGKSLGIMATFVSVGVATGPVLGGFLSQYLSWHWIFFINIPVGIIALILGKFIIPRDICTPSRDERFDALGAGLLFAALGTLLLVINMCTTLGWTSPPIIGCAVTSLVLFGAFIAWERRCPAPLIDLTFFYKRNYTLANFAALFAMLLVTGTSFIMPFFLEGLKGLSTSMAGLMLMVPALALMVMGPVAGALSDRIGSRRLCLAAAACYVASNLLFMQMTEATGFTFILLTLALNGTAAGLFIPPNFNLILGLSPRGREGVVSSIAMTMRNIGSALAVASYGTIFVIAAFAVAGEGAGLAGITLDQALTGFHAVFLCGAVIGAAIFVLTLLAREEPKRNAGNKPGAGLQT
jgi:DHA2 family metal-tetracycline-proton antiporter-like MFS transporter